MNQLKNWKKVIEVFEARLSRWKARSLSMGGRIILIKSVLNALPSYYFSLFRAPNNVVEHLDRIRRRFLWGGSLESTKISWVSWDRVIAAKEVGGLGIGCLKEVNMALLAKWWWRFKEEKGKLWWRTVWAIHQNGRSWSAIPYSVVSTGVWKCIANVEKDFESINCPLITFIKGEIDDGKDIKFWTDNWLEGCVLAARFPLLFRLVNSKSVAVAQCVSVREGTIHWRWGWKQPPSSREEKQELSSLKNLLLNVILSQEKDKWKWTGSLDGVFSTKELKTIIHRQKNQVPYFQIPWNKWLPIKVNAFIWRLKMGKIPLLKTLEARGINIANKYCRLCNLEEESVSHLFFNCRHAVLIWEGIKRWCNIMPIEGTSVRELFCNSGLGNNNARRKKLLEGILMVSLWSIWNCRNKLMYEGLKRGPDVVIEEIKILGYLWMNSRMKKQKLTWPQWFTFDVG